MVECRTPEREVRGSRPTSAVLCPWARHFTPRKYWLITQEAMAPSRHDWKIVDWDVKPQHNQNIVTQQVYIKWQNIRNLWCSKRFCKRCKAVSPEPSLLAHMKYGSRRRVRPNIRHLAQLDGCACVFLKNEFTEDEKCHNLMTWLKSYSLGRRWVLNSFMPSGLLYPYKLDKVDENAMNRNWNNRIPHLAQDTKWQNNKDSIKYKTAN